MGTIVCGYDGSDPCRAALEQAVAIARDSGDTVVVVFGLPVSRLGGEVPDYAKALHERATTVEKHARDQAAALGAEIEVELLEKEAARRSSRWQTPATPASSWWARTGSRH